MRTEGFRGVLLRFPEIALPKVIASVSTEEECNETNVQKKKRESKNNMTYDFVRSLSTDSLISSFIAARWAAMIIDRDPEKGRR